MIRVFFLLLALFTTHASAADAPLDQLRIDKRACQLLTAHRPLPDVAYESGIDVHGNPVVPAEGPAEGPEGPLGRQFDVTSDFGVGESFTIPLTVDLGKRLGLPLGPAAGSRATIAVVTVDGDALYLDGQPLNAAQADNLAVLCLESSE